MDNLPDIGITRLFELIEQRYGRFWADFLLALVALALALLCVRFLILSGLLPLLTLLPNFGDLDWPTAAAPARISNLLTGAVASGGTILLMRAWRAASIMILVPDRPVRVVPDDDPATGERRQSAWVTLRAYNAASRMAENCHPYITSIDRLEEDGTWRPTSLDEEAISQWAQVADERKGDPRDLPPDGRHLFELLSIIEGEERPTVLTVWKANANRDLIHRDIWYRFRVRVAGRELRSKPRTVYVKWKGGLEFEFSTNEADTARRAPA